MIAGAFYPNYFVRSSLGGRVDEKDAVRALNGKDPCSTVYLSGFPSAQPGQLYSKAFAKILGIVGPVSNVSFDGSRYGQHVDVVFILIIIRHLHFLLTC